MNRSFRTPQTILFLLRSNSHVMVVAMVLSASVLLSACALPVEGLWPLSLDSPARTIFVSLDTWHAMIAFRADTPDASRFTPHEYEEWGYAERAWYLEGHTGLTGIVRALFWPTEAVVEIGRCDRVWADRTPQPPSDLFTFRVSDEGFRRLARHLHESISVDAPIASVGQSTFYPAVRSYHLFHTCHQYAAHALREAGLPISAFWAFNRTSLAWQLRRAVRLIEKPPTDIPAGESR